MAISERMINADPPLNNPENEGVAAEMFGNSIETGPGLVPNEGERVRAIRGKYKGRIGYVVNRTAQMVEVVFDRGGWKRLMQSSIAAEVTGNGCATTPSGRFASGQRVKVVSGKYQGQSGVITGCKVKVWVDFDSGDRRCLAQSSVLLDPLCDARPLPPCTPPHAARGPSATTEDAIPERAAPANVPESSSSPASSSCASRQEWGDSPEETVLDALSALGAGWELSPAAKQRLMAAPCVIFTGTVDTDARDAVVVDPPTPPEEVHFLALQFRGRVVTLSPRNGSKYAPAPTRLSLGGMDLELVCTKLGSVWQWYYVVASGAGLPELRVAEELQRMADFAAVCPVAKRAARLQLLVSPVLPAHMLTLHAGEFEVIDDVVAGTQCATDGCGFVPEEMLQRLVMQMGVEPSVQRGACAVQARVYAPGLGVFKGMLVTKPGIRQIQLRVSMRKVARSRMPYECADVATVAIKQIFPRASHARRRATTKLSPMLLNLWRALEVPRGVVDAYRKQSGVGKGNHAFLVGVCDPFNALPEGTVFAPGVPGSKAFVTRFPCVKAEDGRVLPLATERPSEMSVADWTWLNTLPFGVMMFSVKGSCSLPDMCAKGDLDGDLYFCCWDSNILANVCPVELQSPDTIVGHEGLSSEPTDLQSTGGAVGTGPGCASSRTDSQPASDSATRSEDPSAHHSMRSECAFDVASTSSDSWLRQVQSHLSNASVVEQAGMVGKLYYAWAKLVRERAGGIRDADSLMVGQAYLDSLDLGKHGGHTMVSERLAFLLNQRTA